MCTCERLHAVLNGSGIKGRIIGIAEANDAVNNSEGILRSVVDLHQQAMLGSLQGLDPPVLRHVYLRPKEIQDPAVIPMDGVRIPMMPDGYSNLKPDIHSDFMPDTIPI